MEDGSQMAFAQKIPETNFHELSEEAQDYAIEKHADFLQQEWDGKDDIENYWKDELAENGFDDAIINFSGFWCQGDGASFRATINTGFFLKKFKKQTKDKKTKKAINFAWKNDMLDPVIYGERDRYYHKHTVKVERNGSEPSYYDIMQDKCEGNEFLENCFKAIHGGEFYIEFVIDEFIDMIENERLDWCDKIYKELQDDYECQRNREYVVESIEANGYQFDEEGELL